MLAILETGLLMLGILHNFIDLFYIAFFLREKKVSHIATCVVPSKGLSEG